MGATVLEERSGAVRTLRLNRPQKLNALVPEMGHALVEGLRRAGEDASVRAVVITGAGRAFCAGGDLELLRDVRRRGAMRELEGLLIAGKEICLAIADMAKPVIAAVNGPAAGGGMNLALACDMRIASSEAKFAESFANVGLYPDFGGTYFLPRIVGAALAAVKRAALGEERRALESKLDEEVRMQIRCFESEDCLEALNAFSEKRKPNFRGS